MNKKLLRQQEAERRRNRRQAMVELVGGERENPDKEDTIFICKVTVEIGEHTWKRMFDQRGMPIPGARQTGGALRHWTGNFLGKTTEGSGLAASHALQDLVRFLNKTCDTPVVLMVSSSDEAESFNAGADPTS